MIKINVRLNEQEEAIMRIIWQLQEPFVLRQLLDGLPTPQPLPHTLASIVKDIEAKGYLCSTQGQNEEYRVLINKIYNIHSEPPSEDWYATTSEAYRNLVQQFAQRRHLSQEERGTPRLD